MEMITFKRNTAQLLTGIFLVLFAAVIEGSAILFSADTENRVLVIAGVSVVLVLPLLLYGLFFLYIYGNNGKNIKKALEEYGEDALKRHIESNTQMTYKMRNNVNYFTDKLIVDPSQGVIPYPQIAYMYVTSIEAKNTKTTSITIHTYDGEDYAICPKIPAQDAGAYMNFIHEKNPGMIVGYSDRNMQAYLALAEKYKKGEITIPHTEL